MTEKIAFITHKIDEETEGRFAFEPSWDKLFDAYYDAAELYELGLHKKALCKFRYILKKEPGFFPAISDIGESFAHKDNHSKALEYYSRAYEIVHSKVPDNFNGTIIWGIIDNRYYLRILHNLGLSFVYSGQPEKALPLFERLLVYNPNDNQGIRYLIGDVYFMLGNYEKAEATYKENLDDEGYFYSYGLLLFQFRRFTESIIYFSKGIIGDEFYYKILQNEEIGAEDNYDNSYHMRTAYYYLQFNLELWFRGKGLEFLKQIYWSETFNLYYGEIKKIRKKLCAIKGVSVKEIKMRDALYKQIQEIEGTIDSDFALKIFNEISKNKRW